MANQTLRTPESLSNDSLVKVTHVDSPVRFYCRLVADDESFGQLNDLIAKHVASKQTDSSIGDLLLDEQVLIFSSVHNCWCRARLLNSYQDVKSPPSVVKVSLICSE